MNDIDISAVVKIVWPIALLQLALIIWALVDLWRTGKTRNLTPIIWTIIIIFGELLGSVLYFLLGRNQDQ